MRARIVSNFRDRQSPAVCPGAAGIPYMNNGYFTHRLDTREISLALSALDAGTPYLRVSAIRCLYSFTPIRHPSCFCRRTTRGGFFWLDS